jgi:hypothetical protein
MRKRSKTAVDDEWDESPNDDSGDEEEDDEEGVHPIDL